MFFSPTVLNQPGLVYHSAPGGLEEGVLINRYEFQHVHILALLPVLS